MEELRRERKAKAYNGELFSWLYGRPEELAMMAQATLANRGRLALLPSGQIAIRRVRTIPVQAPAGRPQALRFTPAYWLETC